MARDNALKIKSWQKFQGFTWTAKISTGRDGAKIDG